MASTMKFTIVSPKDEIIEPFSQNEFFQEKLDSVLVFVKKRKYFVLLETRREFTINFKLVHAGNGMRKLNESLFEIYDKNPSNVKIASKIVEKDQNLSRVQNFFAFQFVSTSETFAGYNSTFKFIFTFTDDNTEVESQEFRVISRCMNSSKLISREAKNYSECQQQQTSPQAGIPSKKRSPQAFKDQENEMVISEKDDDMVAAAVEPALAINTFPSMMVDSGTSAKKLKMASASAVFQAQEAPQQSQPQPEVAPNLQTMVTYPTAQPQQPQQAPQLDVLVQLQQMLGTLIAQQQQQLHQQQQLTAAAAQMYFPQQVQQQNAQIAFQLQQQLQLIQQQPQPQYIYASAPQAATPSYIMMPTAAAAQHHQLYVPQQTMLAAPQHAATFDMVHHQPALVKQQQQQQLLASTAAADSFSVVDDMDNFFGENEFSMA